MKQYAQQLRTEEKSRATIEKYLRDVRRFGHWPHGQGITKEQVIGYKQQLLQSGYALRSVNSMLASVNHFLCFCNLPDCRVRLCRIQREVYEPADRELTKEEYQRLLRAAKGDRRRAPAADRAARPARPGCHIIFLMSWRSDGDRTAIIYSTGKE